MFQIQHQGKTTTRFLVFYATITFHSWAGCRSWYFRKEEKLSSQHNAPRGGYIREKFYWSVFCYSCVKYSNTRLVCWDTCRCVISQLTPSCSIITKPTNCLSSHQIFVVVEKQLLVRFVKVTTIGLYMVEGKKTIFTGAIYSFGPQTSQCIVLLKCIIQNNPVKNKKHRI
jgi:hypothetical protein